MAWWLKNNLRMIQNNLRDIDAELIDPEKWFQKEPEVTEPADVSSAVVGSVGGCWRNKLNIPQPDIEAAVIKAVSIISAENLSFFIVNLLKFKGQTALICPLFFSISDS